MHKAPLILLFLQFALTPLWSHGQSRGQRTAERAAVKSELSKRKKGFDKYIRERDQLKNRSEKAIEDIQEDRERREAKKIIARKGFSRDFEVFPFAAYRRFIKKRDEKREEKLSVQDQYRDYKKWLRRIENQRRYKINKEKAYRLE